MMLRRRCALSTLGGQPVTASLRAFCNAYSWGKPYVEAGLGYAWQHDAPGSDGSYVWRVAAGTEFQVAPAVTVTPSTACTKSTVCPA